MGMVAREKRHVEDAVFGGPVAVYVLEAALLRIRDRDVFAIGL